MIATTRPNKNARTGIAAVVASIVLVAGCSSAPAPGKYHGKTTALTQLEDMTGTPIGEKTRTAGEGDVTIAADGPDALTLDVRIPRLACKLPVTKGKPGFVVTETSCPLAQSDAPNAGTMTVKVGGRVDRVDAKTVSIALAAEATGRMSSMITFDGTL